MERLGFWIARAPEYQAMNLRWYRRFSRPWLSRTFGAYMTLEGNWACSIPEFLK